MSCSILFVFDRFKEKMLRMVFLILSKLKVNIHQLSMKFQLRLKIFTAAGGGGAVHKEVQF